MSNPSQIIINLPGANGEYAPAPESAWLEIAAECEAKGELGLRDIALDRAVSPPSSIAPPDNRNGFAALQDIIGTAPASSTLLGGPLGGDLGVPGGMVIVKNGEVEAESLGHGELVKSVSGKTGNASAATPQYTPSRISPLLYQAGAYNGIKDPQSATGRTMNLLCATARRPEVWAVLNTRATQISDYCERSDDHNRPGWNIFLRNKHQRITPAIRKKMEFLAELVEYGGQRRNLATGKLNVNRYTREPGVWNGAGMVGGEDPKRAMPFSQYLYTGTFAMLTYDSFAVQTEPGRDANEYPVAWVSPADSMRIWPTVEFGPRRRHPSLAGNADLMDYVKYVEVSPDNATQVVREYDWTRMMCLIRRPRLDIQGIGFGVSEVEIALEIANHLLLGLEFQSSYFDKNHLPVGILQILGQTQRMSGATMEFIRTQLAQIGGMDAFWKMLLVQMAQGPNGQSGRVEWTPLRNGVSELQFIETYFNFLYNILCAVCTINAEEVGFKASNPNGPSLSQGGQEISLEHSRDKGFLPLMRAHGDFVNRQRIEPYDPDNSFEFRWVGLNPKDAQREEMLATSMMARGVSLNEIRDEHDEARVLTPTIPQMWSAIARKYPEDDYDSTEDWRDAINDRYWRDIKKRLVKQRQDAQDEQNAQMQALQASQQQPGAAQPGAAQPGMPQPAQPGVDPTADATAGADSSPTTMPPGITKAVPGAQYMTPDPNAPDAGTDAPGAFAQPDADATAPQDGTAPQDANAPQDASAGPAAAKPEKAKVEDYEVDIVAWSDYADAPISNPMAFQLWQAQRDMAIGLIFPDLAPQQPQMPGGPTAGGPPPGDPNQDPNAPDQSGANMPDPNDPFGHNAEQQQQLQQQAGDPNDDQSTASEDQYGDIEKSVRAMVRRAQGDATRPQAIAPQAKPLLRKGDPLAELFPHGKIVVEVQRRAYDPDEEDEDSPFLHNDDDE